MSKLRLRIFDGTRQPFALPAQFLVRIVDGNQHQLVLQYYSSNDINFDLPFLASGPNDAKGEQRYNDLLENKSPSLASIHNLCEAMSQINLAQGTPLTYIQQLIWDGDTLPPGAEPPAQDRFFARSETALIDHENDTATIDGVPCVMIEPDMDYFKDPAAHVLLEVIPNALTQTLTNPAEVYVLRWIAGQTAGVPEFAPHCTIR